MYSGMKCVQEAIQLLFQVLYAVYKPFQLKVLRLHSVRLRFCPLRIIYQPTLQASLNISFNPWYVCYDKKCEKLRQGIKHNLTAKDFAFFQTDTQYTAFKNLFEKISETDLNEARRWKPTSKDLLSLFLIEFLWGLKRRRQNSKSTHTTCNDHQEVDRCVFQPNFSAFIFISRQVQLARQLTKCRKEQLKSQKSSSGVREQ